MSRGSDGDTAIQDDILPRLPSAARLGASFRRPGHGALLRLALRCACEAGCGLRGHQRARLAAMRTIASFKRMIRLRREPLLKGRGRGCFCVVAAIQPHRNCRSIAAAWAVMLCAHCGPPAPWSSSMPLTGIVELSSLNEGERGQTTSEASGRKCTPRPACITRRSWRACLRLGDARERTLSNARTRKSVRGVVLAPCDNMPRGNEVLCAALGGLFEPEE